LLNWSGRHVRWADLEAQELLAPRRASAVQPDMLGSPIEKKRWLRDRVYGGVPLFVRPFLYFLYRYVVKLGFLDGIEGLMFHFLQGCWFRFLVDARIRELKNPKTNDFPIR